MAYKIEVDRNGFGLASLFTKESTKEVLTTRPDMNGLYLDELGISYEVGDEINIRFDIKNLPGSYRPCKVKVYKISKAKEIYYCEFLLSGSIN
jgi:hypothetical protein